MYIHYIIHTHKDIHVKAVSKDNPETNNHGFRV